MRKHIGISALAFGVALVAATPSFAQLAVNLGGGDPLVTVGSEPTVDVNLGGDAGVTVDLGGTPDVTVDTTTEPGGDVTVDIDGADGDNTGIGDIVDLDNTDNTIGVDLNNNNDDNDVVVGLPGGDDVFVDLFGNGGAPDNTTQRLVDLNTDADAVIDLDAGEDGVILDLFGEEGGATAPLEAAVDLDLDLDQAGGDGLGVDLDGLLGGDVIPDLFGDGGAVEVLDLGDLSGPAIDLPALDGIGLPEIGLPEIGMPEVDLPVGTAATGEADDGEDGVDGVDRRDGDTDVVVVGRTPGIVTPTGDGDPRGTTNVLTNRAVARTQVATNTRVAAPAPNTKCFTPDDNQIAHLVQSRTYSDQGIASWQNAGAVNLVPVRLCPEARVKVSEVTYADDNMAIMRNGIEGSAAIQQKLSGNGLDADNVLAVDAVDGAVTVYVY